MKDFLKRAGMKIARFFWSWGFLKFILWSITIVVLFYVEEDWRGAHEWDKTKMAWEAKGESFDYAKFVPPPVPDAENLAALPIFKVDPGTLRPELLVKDMRGTPSDNFPQIGSFMRGEMPDMSKISLELLKQYGTAFPSKMPPPESLAQFDALYPFINDLRAVAATHLLCRFDGRYDIWPPENRPLGMIVDNMKLAKLVTLHAILALHENRSDLALADLKLNYRLAAGAERDPSLVGGLVANSIEAISGNAIVEGFTLHAWNDAQLAEIQNSLSRFDLLRVFQFDLRAEVAIIGPDYDFFKNNCKLTLESWPTANDMTGLKRWALKLSLLWPTGWIDLNKSPVVDSLMKSVTIVNPGQHRAFPDIAREQDMKLQKSIGGLTTWAPWNFISVDAMMAIEGPAQGFARNQVIVIDEERIACALERYRMTNGAFPGSLNALAPTCIDVVPRDIMTGEPYHYRVKPDGTYLLYSVGWNQTDDGGKIAYKKDVPKLIDYSQGDWTWPTPQPAP